MDASKIVVIVIVALVLGGTVAFEIRSKRRSGKGETFEVSPDRKEDRGSAR